MKNGLVTGTFTLNGRVFALHKAAAGAADDAPSLKTEINTEEILEDFCRNFIKVKLDSFLDSEGRKIFQ